MGWFIFFPYLGSQVAGLMGPHGLYTVLPVQLYAVWKKKKKDQELTVDAFFAAKVTTALPSSSAASASKDITAYL